MKKTALVSILSIAAAAALASPFALAESTSPLVVEATKLAPQQARDAFKQFKGTYDMDDGTRLSFTKAGSRYYAVIDANAPVEIRPSAPDRFVSISGRSELRFALDRNGTIATVVLTKDAGTQLASAAPAAPAL